MKSLLSALALVIAAPVAAQTPAADPHAEHREHSQQQQQKSPPPAGQHDKHMMNCKDCCEEMKKRGEKMDCCDEHSESDAKAPQNSQHNH